VNELAIRLRMSAAGKFYVGSSGRAGGEKMARISRECAYNRNVV